MLLLVSDDNERSKMNFIDNELKILLHEEEQNKKCLLDTFMSSLSNK